MMLLRTITMEQHHLLLQLKLIKQQKLLLRLLHQLSTLQEQNGVGPKHMQISYHNSINMAKIGAIVKQKKSQQLYTLNTHLQLRILMLNMPTEEMDLITYKYMEIIRRKHNFQKLNPMRLLKGKITSLIYIINKLNRSKELNLKLMDLEINIIFVILFN